MAHWNDAEMTEPAYNLPHEKRCATVVEPHMLQGAWAAAILLFVSAVWVESDIYRYAALAMLPFALWHYLRSGKERVRLGWAGQLCVAWGLYVIIRLAYSGLFYPELGSGSSEGIYIFPLFYTLLGYTLFVYVTRPFWLVSAFIVISAAMVLASTDYAAIFEGSRSWMSFHNNPIHASVANGIIVLCSLSYICHVLRRGEISGHLKMVLVIIAALAFTIGMMSLYVLQSKGVWASLAVALPLLVLLIVLMSDNWIVKSFAGISLLVTAVTVIVFWPNIESVAGQTYREALELAVVASTSADLTGSINEILETEALPESMHIRLLLWANAVHIWFQQPIFGAGISWMHSWDSGPYGAMPFNLLHNGYLEIAIRYGLVGILFYAALYSWCSFIVYRAYKFRIIPAAAFQAYITVLVFFALTLLTNSNLRIAIGESLLWFLAGFAFYCYFRLQKNLATQPPAS